MFSPPLRILFIILLLSAIFGRECNAQEKPHGAFAYGGFSGGMMIHTGYVGGAESRIIGTDGELVGAQSMRGMPFGIGGAIRLHFGNWLRLGSEGYQTVLNYGPHKGFCSLGWGGLLIDAHHRIGRFDAFAGLTVGGGGVKNLTLLSPSLVDFRVEENASFRRYGVALIDPFVGTEYVVSDKLRIQIKADYILNLTPRKEDFVRGVRLYLGVVFYRLNSD